MSQFCIQTKILNFCGKTDNWADFRCLSLYGIASTFNGFTDVTLIKIVSVKILIVND